ncbi:hypothetical protein BCAR13_80136 [Paraburkholderia caribensis]|nr:hypothetical protein BCAR13_80136 [Paraburkholderia caribensis]
MKHGPPLDLGACAWCAEGKPYLPQSNRQLLGIDGLGLRTNQYRELPRDVVLCCYES